MFALVVLFGKFVLAGLISKITKISKMGHQRILRKSMFSHVQVLESMRARQPGLQAPSNLTGSKIKNTHFFPLSILSQRNDIQYWEKHLYHVRLTVSCLHSEGKAIKSIKYAFLQAPSNHKNRLAGSGGDSRTSPRNTQNTRILSSINREPRYQIEYFNTTRARPQLDFFFNTLHKPAY